MVWWALIHALTDRHTDIADLQVSFYNSFSIIKPRYIWSKLYSTPSRHAHNLKHKSNEQFKQFSTCLEYFTFSFKIQQIIFPSQKLRNCNFISSWYIFHLCLNLILVSQSLCSVLAVLHITTIATHTHALGSLGKEYLRQYIWTPRENVQCTQSKLSLHKIHIGEVFHLWRREGYTIPQLSHPTILYTVTVTPFHTTRTHFT